MKNSASLILILGIIFSCFTSLLAQNTMSEIYQSDIPTSVPNFDQTCNGPGSTVSFTLPPGENITITNAIVIYEFVSVGTTDHTAQRSAIFCQNTGIQETPSIGTVGSQDRELYFRENVNIANGTYPGGTEITFEIRAWRTQGGTGCGTNESYIEAGTYIQITYGDPFASPKIGVNTNTPEAVLDVNGRLKIGDDNTPVLEGNVRYNENLKDFQGYDGSDWKSFTVESSGIFGSEEDIPFSELNLIPNPNPTYNFFGARGDQILEWGNSMVVSNENQIYLFKKIGNSWELKDSIQTLQASVELIENNKIVVASGYIVKTYSISADELNLISVDYNSIGSDIQTLKFNGNHCYMGDFKNLGQVQIFDTTTTPWTIEQTLLPPFSGVTNDKFGAAVHLYRDRLYVGSTQHEDVGAAIREPGVVYVYKNISNSWQLVETIFSPNPSTNWKFGSNIKSFENELFIGSDPRTKQDNGAIAVYEIGEPNHTLKHEITSGNPTGGFGNKFAFQDDNLIITSDYSYQDSIYAFIYKKDNSWTFRNKLKAHCPGTNYETNVGISNNQVYWSISNFQNNAEHGIYYLDRSDVNSTSFYEINNIPAGLLDGDDVDDADSDPTNEIQTIARLGIGNTIMLSNGGGSFIDQTNDADASSTNELVNSLNLSNTTLTIQESGNTKSVNLSSIASQWENDGADIYFNNKVGIGTINPLEALDVQGTIQIKKNSGVGGPQLNLVENSSSYARINMTNSSNEFIAIAGRPSATIDNAILNFYIDGAGDIMTLKGDKKVGINDNSPNKTLEVNAAISDDPLIVRTGGVEHFEILENGHLLIGNNVVDETNKLIKASNGAYLSTGGTWTNASSRELKQNFESVASQDILVKLAALNILKWNYKLDSSAIHLGPIAEEFYETFGLGGSEKSISTVDASGVALVAIQALNETINKIEIKNNLLCAENDSLANENKEMKKMMQLLIKRVEVLEEEK